MATKALSRVGVELTKREVVPVVSKNPKEARKNVIKIYKEFQRYVPTIWWEQELRDIPLPQFRLAIKNQFMKNAHLTDTRVVDRLVEQAKLDMVNFRMAYYNDVHVRNFLFRENIDPKPADFLSRFFAGKD
uniref:NADH dehydrogenase [ubiquinone] 1 alpha subcomplex subunit 6 n=1 Tax=Plectus sambesii TaxID=2011161 RepID=A0A914X873_9BILA